MSKQVNVKGDQKMEVLVNDYSLSQCGEQFPGGISETAQPTPVTSVKPEALINALSLSNLGKGMGSGRQNADGVNDYSLSMMGIALK